MDRPIDSRNRLPTKKDANKRGKVLVWFNEKWTPFNWDALQYIKRDFYWRPQNQPQQVPEVA